MPRTIRYLTAPCPLGVLLLAAGDRGICQLRLGDDVRALEGPFLEAFPEAHRADESDVLHAWSDAIVCYLDARGGAPPELPLELRGTPFQQRVWSALREIPPGEVRRYGEIAHALDVPGGARAVAGACARNPVALLVPCHRVVPQTGETGGYRWGRWRKKALLRAERLAAQRSEPDPPRRGGTDLSLRPAEA